jgi:5-formyltetrahydrofolate cyclo-ligase
MRRFQSINVPRAPFRRLEKQRQQNFAIAAAMAEPAQITPRIDQMDKRELRKHIRSILSKLSPDRIRTQSSLITRHCLLMSCVDRAKGASIFLSRPQVEVQTFNLCRELGKRGITLFVPHMVDGEHMEMLQLNAGEDIQVFPRDKWGIPVIPQPETRRKAGPAAIDIVFTPGVAFDLTGRRLGNGKGYYDRFFHEYDTSRIELGLPKVQKYGLALEEMLLSHVPTDEHDVILDGVIMPLGVFSSMHI